MIFTYLHSLDSLQIELIIATTHTHIVNKMHSYEKYIVMSYIHANKYR